MPSIYIMAIITTLFSLLLYGGFIAWRTPRKDLPFLALVLLAMLPMEPISFYLVRMPINSLLVDWLGKDSSVYRFLTTFYAPLTEEPAKLWILLIPWFAKRIEGKGFVRVAMTIGLGFGIGELWMLAEKITHNEELSAYPWYMYTGFLNERFIVCIMHSGMTALALSRWRKNFILGVLGAMSLHYIGNLPLFLKAIDLGGLGETTWGIIVNLWITVYFLLMITLLVFLATRKIALGQFFFGEAKCPECGAIYPRPFWLGVNMVTKRYERCPHCKKWHWISLKDVIKPGKKSDQEPTKTM
jgi:hypothetical protein